MTAPAPSRNTLFTGLSAFPLTPADGEGVVDVDGVGMLVERLCDAGVDSIGVLGSTGIYAYLDRAERKRTVAGAVEAAAGRVPLIVGIGALRTTWAIELARDAERAGAGGLLLAPVSYTPLLPHEVAQHYRAVAGATGLPLCIYNNPGTTRFAFSPALIAELASLPNVAAIKMPLPADGHCAGELSDLRRATSPAFRIGYSGDWGMAGSLLAGADAFYSVLAGLLPGPALRLVRAARAGRRDETAALDAALAPLWALFRAHGGLRIMYALARHLGLPVGQPPAPLLPVDCAVADAAVRALDALPTDQAIPDQAIPGQAIIV